MTNANEARIMNSAENSDVIADKGVLGGVMQLENVLARQSTSFNISSTGLPILEQSIPVIDSVVDPSEDSARQDFDDESRLLYLYGTPPLILFCVISVAVNIKILISVYWIRRPLSPTLYISLSLAGSDAFSSTALGIGLVMNSLIPHGLGLPIAGVDCFLLGLEAIRLGAVIITVSHLMALAINHYLGILKPLQYISIVTHRNITFIIVLLWILPLAFFLVYFSIIENEGFQSDECKTKTFLYHKKFRLLFSSLFFGPFILMVCIYTHIFCIVKRHQASRLRFSRAGSSFCRADTDELRSTSHQMARNVKAVHTTLYILGSFLIGWMPATIAYMLICEDCPLQFDWASGHVRFFLYNAINYLIIFKTLVNPIIYAARMHEIKVATRRMHAAFFDCIGLTGLTTVRGTMRTQHSEDMQSNRQSLSKTAVCRMVSNVSVKNQRNGISYTYAGYNVRGCSNTNV